MPNPLLVVLLLPLAVWRITAMIMYERGPFDIFPWFKDLVGVDYDENGLPYGKNVLSKLFSCFWCLSIWVSAILCMLVLDPSLSWQLWILLCLSASTVAIWMDNRIR